MWMIEKCPVVTPWVVPTALVQYNTTHSSFIQKRVFLSRSINKSIFLAFVIEKIGGTVIDALKV